MSVPGEQEYLREFRRLKACYGDRIKLYCGVEKDMYSASDCSGFEYVIGTLHVLPSAAGLSQVEGKVPLVERLVQEEFGGSADALAHAYLRGLGAMALAVRPQIVGHFDVFLKRLRVKVDTESAAYRKTVTETLEIIRSAGSMLEVNTGGMVRAGQPYPYPEPWTLKRWREMGGQVIVGSDCHQADQIAAYFDEAVDYMQAAGFSAYYRLSGGEGALFEEVPLR